MNISSFDDLLTMARQQQLPQRLLFVFAGIELPADSTPEQLARFEAGQGGAVDVDDVNSFAFVFINLSFAYLCRIIGRIIQHLDFEFIGRVIHRDDIIDQSFYDKAFIEYR